MRSVVITGMGLVSPIGVTQEDVISALKNGRSGISNMPEWSGVKGLRSLIAGKVCGIDPKTIPRNNRRTMGRVAVLGSLAALDAVRDAGLLNTEMLESTRTGVVMGSTTGSGTELENFFRGYISNCGIEQQEGTLFMKIMSHTVASNVAALLKVRGRVAATCSACASSTQAIGMGYEAIREGHQDIMICGGAEDLHPMSAGIFDILNVASKAFLDTPTLTPRPFDRRRDGLVVGEGGGAVVLESLEHAKARGVKILGEIGGYATFANGSHMTSPDVESMTTCMQEALEHAKVKPCQLDYINAHATATEIGDIEEAAALRNLVGDTVPISSFKGHIGHTLAASGAIETIFCLIMMEIGFIAPTLNLDDVDPRCAGVQHVLRPITISQNIILKNSFAFGGIGASLVLKRYYDA